MEKEVTPPQPRGLPLQNWETFEGLVQMSKEKASTSTKPPQSSK